MTDFKRARATRLGLAAFALALAAGVWPGVGPAQAQSDDAVVILLNARNPTQSLSKGDLNKIFMGQTAFWHGVVPVKVLLRPDGSQAAKVFYDKVLSTTPQAFRKHWDELQLAGRGVAPRVLGSVEELAQAIAQAPGSIGFALASEAWGLNGNKAIKVINPT
jgi:ABC-type phosphate transport system substrate-binding protein